MSSLSKKKPAIISNSAGTFALFETRLAEVYERNVIRISRWVKRSDLKGLKSGKTKHIRLWYGIFSSQPVSVTLFAKEKILSIGCIQFHGDEVTQIMEWINKKGK